MIQTTEPPPSLSTRVRTSQETHAPLLHHLNADTTWLLQLPLPSPTPQKHYYNILLDPWLTGSQSDVAAWFSRQWHTYAPARGSIDAVEQLIRDVENLCSSSHSSSTLASSSPALDLVAISHEFTDHCHKETLLQVAPSVPVLAAPKASALVKGWRHFETVHDLPSFSADQPAVHALAEVLPAWVNISRLTTGGNALYYHSAIVVVWGTSQESMTRAKEDDTLQAVMYTPHGIHAETVRVVAEARPRIETRALLHGLHDVRIDWGQQLNLGAHNGLLAARLLEAKYWVGTHDEVKKGGGLVSWLLRRKIWTVAEALEREQSKEEKKVRYLEVGNGESEVLV